MNKPIVGQIVYSLNVGNAARNCEQKLTEMTVTKVGRKYFTCLRDGWSERAAIQFHLDTWTEKTDYCSSHALYVSPQEWEDAKEATRICKKINDYFEYGRNSQGISLKNLRMIEDILERPEEVNERRAEESTAFDVALKQARKEFLLSSDDFICDAQRMTVAIPELMTDASKAVTARIRDYREKLHEFMLRLSQKDK